MNTKLIEEKYLKKINQFTRYNKSYYLENKSIISDRDFDDLKREILELENKYKFLNDKDSPSVSVGFKPSKNFKKEKHKVPMLSLGNAFDENDLINFEKKILIKLNTVQNLKLMEYQPH